MAVRLNPPPADAIELDSRDIYKEFRIRGYDYGQVGGHEIRPKFKWPGSFSKV